MKRPTSTCTDASASSAVNYKGQLQEFCMKQWMDLPVYKSEVNGPDHATCWNSTVKVGLIEFIGEIKRSKIKAEQSAAERALDYIKKYPGTIENSNVGLNVTTSNDEKNTQNPDSEWTNDIYSHPSVHSTDVHSKVKKTSSDTSPNATLTSSPVAFMYNSIKDVLPQFDPEYQSNDDVWAQKEREISHEIIIDGDSVNACAIIKLIIESVARFKLQGYVPPVTYITVYYEYHPNDNRHNSAMDQLESTYP